MTKRFLQLLIEATRMVPAHYFQLPITGGEEAIYRERVYSYELYHQLRTLLEADQQLARYVLSGEVDKRAHPIIERSCAPDFAFHIPGEMDNSAIIEVKPVNARQDEIQKDLEKLTYFVSPRIGYQVGIQLVYGDDARGFEKFGHLYRRANHPQFQLLWHRSPGERARRIYP